jgi:hypothetical protein
MSVNILNYFMSTHVYFRSTRRDYVDTQTEISTEDRLCELRKKLRTDHLNDEERSLIRVRTIVTFFIFLGTD